MPDIIKVQEQDASGNTILRQSSSDIVSFDPSNAKVLVSDDVQSALLEVDDTISDINETLESQLTKHIYQCTVKTSDFEDSIPYTATVTVDGIKSTDKAIVDVILSDDTQTAIEQTDAYSCITSVNTEDGQVIVKCLEEKPTVDLTLQLMVID